jgi:hypothetical protein
MDTLTTFFSNLTKKPKFASAEYKKWIEQDDFVHFLQVIPKLDKWILYGSVDDLYLYSVLVPTRLVNPPNIVDIKSWSCNPFSSWGITIAGAGWSKISLSPPLHDSGSKTIEQGEQIVFARTFEGKQEQKSYFEISQRLTHSLELHYVPERSAYCRFDDLGDIEDVIQTTEMTFGEAGEKGRSVIMDRHVLNEYLTLTKQSLLFLFDSTRLDSKNFNGWGKQNLRDYEASPDIWYYMGRTGGTASYIRGFQIIRSPLKKKDLPQRFGFGKSKGREYVTFLTQDWKHNLIQECSSNPDQLGNYFIESDLPFEISPVFFRPEVISKYKADSDKYQFWGRSIICRDAWELKSFDTNDAGQVFAYIKDLSHLPYKEQLYWKSFNEFPKAPISKRAFETDFEGKWAQEYDPLLSLKYALQELQEKKVWWWILHDESLIEQIQYPITKSPDEWAKEIHSLDKLVTEGFEARLLRSQVINHGGTIDNEWKSLRLLQEVLIGFGKGEIEIKNIIGPLKELNFLRNKVIGHASGDDAMKIKTQVIKEHKTYWAHFRHLCAGCDNSIRQLRIILLIK